jgi:uncharacterized damage-inducible protein DinB
MNVEQASVSAIYEGWRSHQNSIGRALASLTAEQFGLRAGPGLRSVGEITAHVIGARARWFYQLMGEGGQEFAALGKWDRRGAPDKSAAKLIQGLEATWQGMHEAMKHWTPEEWLQTWPGEDPSEPEVITRPWVIWHLIEHDLHHGGEISITLARPWCARPRSVAPRT